MHRPVLRPLVSLLFVLALVAGLFTPLPARAQDAPPERVVVRIYFNSTDQLNDLASRLDVWEVNHAEGWLVAMVRSADVTLYTHEGYRVELDDAKTAMVNTPLTALPGQTQGIPSYPCYRTVEETYAAMQTLNTTYPGLVTLTDIGNSWDKVTAGGPGGYDIWDMTLTNEANTFHKPVFFLMGEIHARELVTAETVLRMSEYLLTNYGVDPDVTWLLDYYELHMVPMTNPDGRKFAETGEWWRKNTDNDDGCTSYPDYGTDLNRNHSFKWGGAGTNPCDETYQGPYPYNPEPEIQAIQNRVLALLEDERGPGDTDPAPLDYEGIFITLHSYSNLVMWPWGWSYSDSPNHTQLQTLGRKMAFFNGYEPQPSADLYTTTGTSDDWAYGVLGAPAFIWEMGEVFFQSCSSFESTVYPDNLDALMYSAKTTRMPYVLGAGPESLNVAVSQSTVSPGTPVTLTATANDTRYQNSNGTEPTQAIAEARYSIDTPSWITGAVTYPMSPVDGNFNSTIENLTAVVDTTVLLPGRHTLFVESKDAAGNWGVASAVFLTIDQPGAGLASLTPPTAEVFARPGETVQYTFTLTNAGGLADDFTLSVDSAWTASVDPALVADLASGASVDVTVTVTVPADATDSGVATLLAVPEDNVLYSDTSTLTTRLQYIHVNPHEDAKTGFPGDVVTYSFTATSTDTVYHTFSIIISGNAWTSTPTPGVIGLNPGQTKPFTVAVTIPAGALPGDLDDAVVTVRSRSQLAVFDTASITTTAIAEDVGIAQLTPETDAASGDPGTGVTYTLTLTNLGTVADTFTLSADSTWEALISPLTVDLDPGADAEITVTVNIPAEAVGEDVAVITATPDDGAQYSDSSTLTTTAILPPMLRLFLPMILR
ncbi:MAG TPA: M14 family zinc carboxypeptidase [Anaerolineaceae bacterium]|nr:M14 family zinc carboxypeptidase [Anaerolineaceae bacterium]